VRVLFFQGLFVESHLLRFKFVSLFDVCDFVNFNTLLEYQDM